MMIKFIHVTAVIISISLFVLRGIWMMSDSGLLQRRWVRIVPHVNDTLLLLSGIWLAISIQQYPFVHHWLTAKLVAVVAYIGLGTLALKRAPGKNWKIIFWLLALLVVAYIVFVASQHAVLPFV